MSESKKNEMREIIIKNEPYHYDERFPLLSIHLASNRPDQFTLLAKNLDEVTANKNAYEIIVKIDTEDTKMIECVNALVKMYGEDRIKPLIGAKKLGPWSTWEFYNYMVPMTHPKAYFVWNPADEVRITTQGWDKVLANYIGFYNDHIFRLKLSDNRLRNFYYFHEVLGSPDNFPIITKKWMDLCGLWGDCHSPDLFQQAVSFHLGKQNYFRDIPIFDIDLAGIEAGLLIPPEQSASRTYHVRRLWIIALSKHMRSRYIAHANKIRFFIQSCAKGATEVKIKEYTDYPSRVICSNDVGMKETVKCLDDGFILHALKLKTQAVISRIKQLVKRVIKGPAKLAILSPLLFTIAVVSSFFILKHSTSLLISLANIFLLAFSVWLMKANNKKGVDLLRSKVKL
jgi:hypothetical protein